ncbi:hypothetical protein EN850_02900 [Mesorhizobium sp. M8A.F.Ca.ET.207.01.1.1]|nr:hypothetical protein EN850_02900 [Mesorhizobium sp. M8A.F.Ca.ET.207.01.1.1]
MRCRRGSHDRPAFRTPRNHRAVDPRHDPAARPVRRVRRRDRRRRCRRDARAGRETGFQDAGCPCPGADHGGA